MSWVAIAVGVTGAAVSAGGAYMSSQKSQEASEELAANSGPENIRMATPSLLGDPAQVNILDILGQLYGANSAGAQDARNQSRSINKFNRKEVLKGLNQYLPGFSQLQSQIGENAQSFAEGNLPADVQSSITRAAAQRGIQGGFGFGSQGAQGGALGNLNLRNLGLTSLDLSKYGTGLAMQASAQARNLLPNMSGMQDFLLNPSQVLGVNQFNVGNQNQFALQNNRTQNEFELLNTGAFNQAQANQNQAQYGAAQQQAQMYGQMGQAIGGGISSLTGGLGTGGGGMVNSGAGNNYGATYMGTGTQYGLPTSAPVYRPQLV